jgi:hypothetical protein
MRARQKAIAEVAVMATKFLCDLPSEILHAIAINLIPSDWSNLRLTCRNIALKTRYACFHEMCFMLSDSLSMTRLLSISQHPEYRSKVRRIWFYDSRLTDKHLRQNWTAPDEDLKPSQTHEAFIALTSAERLMREERLKTLLEEIMLNFQQAGVAPDIRSVNLQLGHGFIWHGEYFTEDQTRDLVRRLGVYGMNRLTRWLNSAQHTETYGGWNDSTDSIWSAIAKAGLDVKCLDLGDSNVYLRWNQFRLCNAFAPTHLRELRLTTALQIFDSDTGMELGTENDSLESFVIFLSAISNLECLFLELLDSGEANNDLQSRFLFHHLVTRTYSDGTSIDTGLYRDLLPKLRVFELSHECGGDDESLLDFLRQRSATLEQVRIRRDHMSCLEGDEVERIDTVYVDRYNGGGSDDGGVEDLIRRDCSACRSDRLRKPLEDALQINSGESRPGVELLLVHDLDWGVLPYL